MKTMYTHGLLVAACTLVAGPPVLAVGLGDDPSLQVLEQGTSLNVTEFIPALVMVHGDGGASEVLLWNRASRAFTLYLNGRIVPDLVTTIDPNGGVNFGGMRSAAGLPLVTGHVDLANGTALIVELTRPGVKPRRYAVNSGHVIDALECDCSDHITLLCTTAKCNQRVTCPGQADATIICDWFVVGPG